MKSLLIFEVKKNRYAINLDYIQRITQVPVITEIPNTHEFVDGMISYENRVIKIVNFRKMIQIDTYEDDLKELFENLKKDHSIWVETLKKSIEEGYEFELTTNPHACNLGKWLDNFTSYDEDVSNTLRGLNNYHKQLHKSAINILKIADKDKEKALEIFNKDIMGIYKSTINNLDKFIAKFDLVADSLQKLLLYNNDGDEFALKVDEIIDIAHVDKDIVLQHTNNKVSQYLELEGVVELNDVLVNVIKSIKLPVREVL
jgi:purine-binding chemotaxis protein CheW